MPQVTQFHDWERSVLDATQDPALISMALRENDSANDWRHFMSCLRGYPDVFEKRTINKLLILGFYGQICTRVFGSSLPTSMMVPMADNYNHSNVKVSPYIFHRGLHKQADPESSYFNPSKFMNDYSKIQSSTTKSTDKIDTQKVPQYFNSQKFDEHESSSYLNVDKALAILRETPSTKIWELLLIVDRFIEDDFDSSNKKD